MHGLLRSHRCVGDLGTTLHRPKPQPGKPVDSRCNSKARTMTEPTLTCPTCRTEIKLTESLAAPLLEDTRRRYEDQIARKEAEVAIREIAIREQQAQVTAARETIDAEVAAKVDEEHAPIAATEAQRAKRTVAIDLDTKAKEIAELNDVLKQRDAKLAEAQQSQADLIQKQRELDDAKREMDLTIRSRCRPSWREFGRRPSRRPRRLNAQGAGKGGADPLDAAADRRPSPKGRARLPAAARRGQELALEAGCGRNFPATSLNPFRRVNSAAT